MTYKHKSTNLCYYYTVRLTSITQQSLTTSVNLQESYSEPQLLINLEYKHSNTDRIFYGTNRSMKNNITDKDCVWANWIKALAAFLPTIEILFLPGKCSSESSEKGKKGKSQIILKLIQIKITHMHDFNTKIQAQTSSSSAQISFVTLGFFSLWNTGSNRMSNKMQRSQSLILFVMWYDKWMELELASRLTNAIKQSSLSDKQTKIFSRPQRQQLLAWGQTYCREETRQHRWDSRGCCRTPWWGWCTHCGRGIATASWDTGRVAWDNLFHRSCPCSHCPRRKSSCAARSFHCHSGRTRTGRCEAGRRGAHHCRPRSRDDHHTPSWTGYSSRLTGTGTHSRGGTYLGAL